MMAHAETVTAENCVSSPKNETPAGSHWFYRVDHVNKRNCWYLRPEGGGVAQAAPETSVPAPAPIGKPSFADARAELRSQPAGREDADVANPLNSTINPAASAGNPTGPANTSIWNATPVTTRWPEMPPSVSAPKTVIATAAANATPPEAVAPRAPAASSSNLPISIEPGMIPFLTAAMIGALACAGVAALVSRRYRRRVRRRKASSARGPIWETTDDDRIVLSDYPAPDDRDYRPRFARGVASATLRPRAPEYAQRAPRRARR